MLFRVRIDTLEGEIRLDSTGLVVREGDTSVYLTAQEYIWLLEHYVFGEELTITSEDGTVTLPPFIAGALTYLIAGIQRT